MKLVPGIRSGSPQLTELTAYFNNKSSPRSKFTCVDNTSPQTLIEDFEQAARRQLFFAYDLLKENEKTYSPEEAWHKTGVELCKASRLHVKAYLIKNYFNYVSQCTDPQIRPVLEQLGKLYALDSIQASFGHFAVGNYYSDDQHKALRLGIYTLLAKIRPNAIAIVDSFDFSDRELNSVLGRRDGNVYENLLAWAQSNPFNKSDISSAYLKHLKPMMADGKSKL